MADVFLNLIDPLEERFSWKDKSDREIELARRDMAEAFGHYSVDELQAGYRHIVLHRRFTTMPNVAEIRQAIEGIIAERNAHEARKKSKSFTPTTDAFLEGLEREKEDAKEWARDWLSKSPLGQESLRDGWCRPLHNIVWQIKYNRTKDGKVCGFEDIKLDDIATQSKYGEELIKEFRTYRGLSPRLERAIILKEKVAPLPKEDAA